MRCLAASCIPILLLVACGGAEQRRERPAALVEAQPVGQALFVDAIDAVGTAMANEQVVLAAPVTERITALHFTDGGYVAKGQVIATLAQAQEHAELAAAQARLMLSQQQLQRLQELKKRGFATNANLDTQIAAADEAKANAGIASATIGDRVIRAPFAGWASLRTVSVGAIMTAGTQIATISDVSRIKLDFTVPETRLTSLRVGQAINAQAAAFADRAFNGVIATIDPVIDPATRAVRVRAILPNPDRALKPGMLMTVRILARQRRAMAVPELAVVGDGNDSFVFLADTDGKAKRVKIVTGARRDGLVEIMQGLSPGQMIVTEGVVKLSDGMPLRLAEGDGKADGRAAGQAGSPAAPDG
jgi:membrane fusion protein (multidrug efflux system)